MIKCCKLALPLVFVLALSPSSLAQAAFQEGRIAFASDRDGNSEIYTISPDGSDAKRITNNSFRDVDPSYSPDASRLIFSSKRNGQEDLFVINSDGSGESQLTNDSGRDFYPAFSPDGSKIVYQSREGLTDKVYVINQVS